MTTSQHRRPTHCLRRPPPRRQRMCLLAGRDEHLNNLPHDLQSDKQTVSTASAPKHEHHVPRLALPPPLGTKTALTGMPFSSRPPPPFIARRARALPPTSARAVRHGPRRPGDPLREGASRLIPSRQRLVRPASRPCAGARPGSAVLARRRCRSRCVSTAARWMGWTATRGADVVDVLVRAARLVSVR